MSHASREKFLLALTFSITNLSKPIRFNRQLILRMQEARCRSRAEALSPARADELWAEHNQQANQKPAIGWTPHASQRIETSD